MRTSTNIIFILTLLGAVSAEKLLNPKAAENFWSLINPTVSKYTLKQAEDDEMGGQKCNRYINKGDEHMIDIGFYEDKIKLKDKEIQVFKMKFFYAKKKDVIKTLKSYDSEQMRIQSKAFGELIRRMVTVEDKEGRVLYFNMIEDIKDALLALGDGNRMKFVESVDGDIVRLELFYDETLLGIFQITAIEKEDLGNNRFHLLVKFIISNHQTETTDKVEIPVFSKDKGTFDAQMSVITSKLVLNDYINCNDDNLNQFNKFGKASFGSLITVIPDAAGSTPTLKKFTLKAPEETADGRIVYVPPQGKDQVGSYQIIIELNGSEMVKADFKRMSNSDYHKFLQNLDIKGIFLSLWDKVQRLFEKKVQEHFNQQNKVAQFDRSKKITHVFESTELTDQAIFDGANLCTLIFQERSDSALVSLRTDYPSFSVVRLTFVRKSFNPEMLGQYYDGVLTMLKTAKAKNLSTKSSKALI